jgi:tripartite-type tricarboxylate transporter receptor subunit TctC
MLPTRRDAVLGAGAALIGAPAFAADFPRGDIQFIIPYAPGGGFDAYVRQIIAPLQGALPKRVNVVPTNIEGAGGAKAVTQLYHARPDGQTIAIVSLPGAIVLQMVQGAGGYDLNRLTWLANMGRDAYGIAVGAKSPIRSYADLIALSKKRPLKFTSTGVASTGRTGTLIASKLLGFPCQVITGYKGTSEYLLAAARGDGDAACCSLTSMQALVKAGVIRIIASFETHSSIPGVPDATTLGKPDLAKIQEFRAVAGPPNLPAPQRDILSASLIKAMANPAVVAWARRNGANLHPESAAATAQILREQTAFMNQWKKVLSVGA